MDTYEEFLRRLHRPDPSGVKHLVVQDVVLAAEAFAKVIYDLPAGRERSLAITKLQESVLWAVEAGAL